MHKNNLPRQRSLWGWNVSPLPTTIHKEVLNFLIPPKDVSFIDFREEGEEEKREKHQLVRWMTLQTTELLPGLVLF